MGPSNTNNGRQRPPDYFVYISNLDGTMPCDKVSGVWAPCGNASFLITPAGRKVLLRGQIERVHAPVLYFEARLEREEHRSVGASAAMTPPGWALLIGRSMQKLVEHTTLNHPRKHGQNGRTKAFLKGRIALPSDGGKEREIHILPGRLDAPANYDQLKKVLASRGTKPRRYE